jgi:hypothetical protein
MVNFAGIPAASGVRNILSEKSPNCKAELEYDPAQVDRRERVLSYAETAFAVVQRSDRSHKTGELRPASMPC